MHVIGCFTILLLLQDPSDISNRKLKRKYEKKKHKSGASQYHSEVDVMEYGSTEDEPISPVRLLCFTFYNIYTLYPIG